jgi:ERCC4-type nuclease
MIILADTREQDIHILKKLDELGIKYKRKKLDFADYSFEINGESYEKKLVIERKKTIDEVIGNFSKKGRDRFRKEFERAGSCKVILMIEAEESDIDKHNYRSTMSPSDIRSHLKTWCNHFRLQLKFVKKDDACDFIINTFREREWLDANRHSEKR